MTVRLNFFLEGKSEYGFLQEVLVPYLSSRGIAANGRMIKTSKTQKGGFKNFQQVWNDMRDWMKEDSNACFTTMFDLYRLPKLQPEDKSSEIPQGFPGQEQAQKLNGYEKVRCLETALADFVNKRFDGFFHDRFIPYIQLHEFETLLLVDVQPLEELYPYRAGKLSEISSFDKPETVNGGENTHPSKRIIDCIPEYEGDKPTSGPIAAADIGLDKLRGKCPHFNEWLSNLENLAKKETP